ncbi:MAG: hypothetical protein WCV70_00060 [Patescibacteria group bacterium]|jgi:hypothetical protein
MEKNLDGIKKLNPEEIKKNRKIVLSYIGEKDSESAKEQKAPAAVASASNKVDGIKSNRISNFKSKVKSMLERPAPALDNQADKMEKIKQEESVKKEIAEKGKLEAEEKFKAEEARRLEEEKVGREKTEQEESAKKEMAKKSKLLAEEKAKAEEIKRLAEEKAGREKAKQEESVKKEIAKKSKLEAEEKAKAEEAKKWSEKLRLEEKIKNEERIIEDNKRLEKIKRDEEIKRIKQEIKLSKIAAAKKRKIKRQKAIKLFRKNLNKKLGEFFSIVKRNFAYGMLYLFFSLIIGYAVFCLLVLRFDNDDNIIGRAARVLPVPAVITSQGIINYYDFRDIKNNNYSNLSLAGKKNSLAKWVILKNLSGKYSLPINSPSEAFAVAFAADEDFNQVGLSRIKKISELLKNVDNLEQLNKYADEYSEVIYYDGESAAEKFGPAVFNLNSGQISDIIFSGDGYYIAQFIDNENGRLGIKYLFVGAKTLDQYVGEKLAKIKIFILAN